MSIPQGLDRNAKTPLLLNWHGGNSSPEESRAVVDIDAKVSDAGMIVVYPRSPDRFWSVGDCCVAVSGSPPRDETTFVRELLRDVQSKVCVDERRIYTNGFSNGGYLSHMLACKMSDVFAAAAPMGSSLVIPPEECNPTRPISIFMTNGTADPLAGYTIPSPLTGGLPPVESHQFWVDKNGCSGQAETFVQKGMATCRRYTECAAADVEVAVCVVEGMGHCLPGMHKQSETNCYSKDDIAFGMPNDDIDGVQMDLDFLLRFTLP